MEGDICRLPEVVEIKKKYKVFRMQMKRNRNTDLSLRR